MTFGRSGGVPPGLGGPEDTGEPVEPVDPALEPVLAWPLVPPGSPLVDPDAPVWEPVLADPDAAAEPEEEFSPVDEPDPVEPGLPGFDPRSFEPDEDVPEEPPPPECDDLPLAVPLWLVTPAEPDEAPPPAPSPGPAVAHAPKEPTKAQIPPTATAREACSAECRGMMASPSRGAHREARAARSPPTAVSARWAAAHRRRRSYVYRSLRAELAHVRPLNEPTWPNGPRRNGPYSLADKGP